MIANEYEYSQLDLYEHLQFYRNSCFSLFSWLSCYCYQEKQYDNLLQNTHDSAR